MTRAERKRPARGSFLAKLTVLEEAVKAERLPTFVPKLKTLNDFQEWTDAALNLSSWSNTKILNSAGPNADLRARLDKIWDILQMLQGRGRKPRPERKQAEVRLWERQVEALNLQVFTLIRERDEAREALSRSETVVASQDKKILELQAQLKPQLRVVPANSDVSD